MTEFVRLIEVGIPLNLEIAPEFKKIISLLQQYGAIEKKQARYFLGKKFQIGRFEPTKKGYGFVCSLFNSHQKDWLIEKNHTQRAQKGDIVLAKNITKARLGKTKAKILQVLQHRTQNVVCYLEKYKLDCIAISIPNEVAYKIKASQKSLKALPSQTILKLNPQNGEVLEILGTLDDPKIDEIIALNLYNKREAFSLQAELQAQSFKEVQISHFKERENLTHLPFCAIDPVGAKDHDDAIFYDQDNAMLYVGIADVSHYVTPNSPLDGEAKSRGFSIYFPHKSIPMLPRTLSENLCSLKEGKNRLAMVWKIRLHKRTKAALNSELFAAIIKVKQKLNYEEVDAFFETQKSTTIKKPLQTMLLSLKELTQKLRKNRLKYGFDFTGDGVELELDKNLELRALSFESQTLSHQLIEECMLLANVESAKLLEQKNAQNDNHLKLGIYRIHPQPKIEKLNELFGELRLLGIWRDKAIPKTKMALHKAILEIQSIAKRAKIQREVDKLIVKSMQQASYASHNVGHFGLGFEAYSHFTSPIRRYSDLILHRILKDKVALNENKQYKDSLPILCDQLSLQEREVAQIELDFQDRKFARYLSKHLGQIYNGIIVSEKSPLIVALSDFPLMGARVITLNGQGVKYQKARIQILEVNLATAKVYGRMVKIFAEGFGGENLRISEYISQKRQKQAIKNKELARREALRIAKKNKQRKQNKIPRKRKKNR